MIELRNITKIFNRSRPDEFLALDGVSLMVEAGKVTVFKGPSGSGKTTLLSIIGCMAKPTSGRVTVGDREVTSLPERFLTEIRRRTFGFIFQQFHLVRGVSGLFGIELSRNFAAPFFARNFSELWSRWHMSLSSWLRDYVYLPVSRALLRRSSRPNTVLNLVVPPLAAMVVSALWHQAAWHILAWGLLWGAFLVAGRIPTLWRPVVPPDRQSLARQVAGALGVTLMLTASNVLFRMDFPEARIFLRGALRPASWNSSLTFAALFILASLAIDWLQHRSGDETAFRRWPLWWRSLALAVAMLAILLASASGDTAPFIYQYF